ncbi:MAG: sigma-70 family RNA polymerase sigma factor, partial [Deltaproteobacteria bacterium]|nr:sigma-70 family RNA polymerase sigma factor [Deltaproteobacteria bacterium]
FEGEEPEGGMATTVSGLASIYLISIDAHEDFDIEDEKSANVEQRTEFMQVRRHMRDAIGALPEKEKQLVIMYYFQNKTLEEIGERMGLSKSWTSRLHARALALLFKRIKVNSQDQNGEGGEEQA